MGNYLDMVNNAKANPAKGTNPNENYAREIMQLFSIGLWELNTDGTLMLDGTGNPIPTYTQTDITEMAGVMTGWTYCPLSGAIKWNSPINFLVNMIAVRRFGAAGRRRGLRHDELARHHGEERRWACTFAAGTRRPTPTSALR